MTSSQKTIGFTALLIIALGFASCGDNFVFNAEKNIPNGQWAYPDTLDFNVPVSDTAQLYNLFIQFAYADTFPNQNIYLKLSTRFPDGKRVSRIRSFDLYDIQGKPTGKCSGATCKAKILLQNSLYFNQIGDYLITLEQYTRDTPLKGVESVGISMEKMKDKR